MTIWWFLTIVCAIVGIAGIVWYQKNSWGNGAALTVIGIVFGITFLIVAIVQPIHLRQTGIRQLKEREQILYQVENLETTEDKVKLNEWILTYNDWVNDVNTSKEVYGWFSWYYNFDMSEHTVIDLQ